MILSRSKFLYFLLLTSFLMACGGMNNKIRYGHHLSHAKKKVSYKSGTNSTVRKDEIFQNSDEASNSNNINSLIFKQKIIPVFEDPKCDTLVFENGKKLEIVLITLDNGNIKYRKCSHTDGPIYNTSTNDVSSIRYASGSNTYFTKQKPVQERPVVQSKPKDTKVKRIKADWELKNDSTTMYVWGGICLVLMWLLVYLALTSTATISGPLGCVSVPIGAILGTAGAIIMGVGAIVLITFASITLAKLIKRRRAAENR